MNPFSWRSLSIFMVMVLSGILSAKAYKGAEYRTIDSFLYGRFEVRYKAPAGSGILASFFTYHEIESLADWNEIDFEILGRYSNDIQMTSIGPYRETHNSHQWVPFDPHLDFHDYAFEWTPAYIAWFVDGEEVYRQSGEHVAKFNRPQKIMMNIWPPNAENWAGVWNDAILPVFAWYEYVSYASYAPDSGTVGTGQNFRPEWRDDFDSWDQARFQKADHTFDGNRCDFEPENAVFKDGKLVLCLTTADQTGYVDLLPPKVLYTHARTSRITLYFSEILDPGTAEKKTNYFINGVTIHEAKLGNDGRTVELTVQDLDPQKTYTMSVLGIADASPNANKLIGQVIALQTTEPLRFPVMINLGTGAPYECLPDQPWDPEQEYGYEDGYEENWSGSIDIAGTDLDSLYLTARREVVGYRIRVPDGRYKLTFMMAENDEQILNNPRLFNINVEGFEVADSINIYQTAGLHGAFDLITPELDITDGILDIHFTNLTNYSLVCGLAVDQLATAAERVREEIPEGFELRQNFPNPFNAATVIGFTLPQPGNVTLEIYDLRGRRMVEMNRGYLSAGAHKIDWQADVASGVYYYRLHAQSAGRDYLATRKMLLIK